MKNTLKLILVITTLFVISCKQQDGYVITGNLTGFPDSTVIYLYNLNTGDTFDSTLIIDNKFQLTGKFKDEPEQVWLKSTVNKQFVYANLLIGNENVKISGDISDFPFKVSITGSKSQDDLNYLNSLRRKFQIKRDSLIHKIQIVSFKKDQEKAKELWRKIKPIDDTTLAIELNFVKSHINTYPGVIYLGYYKKKLPKDTVRALYNKLSDEIKASKYARIIEVFLNNKISEVGDQFHDFKAINQNGDTIQFSDLVDKYVLLDFSETYCMPCELAIKDLRKIKNTLNDSLKIVSFSGDSKKQLWLSTIKRDSITWTNLWDGKGSKGETIIKYGVEGVPTFFLINPNGKIIDKWSGYSVGIFNRKLKNFIK